MKILFINISDKAGGSAKAAYRLGQALEKYHHAKNLFLVRTKISTDKNVIQTRSNKITGTIERGTNILLNFAGMQYQWLPFSPKTILRKASEFKPDIISLHNTIGGYFVTKDLIKLSQIAPIVWTLHDMWAFTGNAAHTFGDESWKEMKTGHGENKIFPWIGINTGRWLLKQKKDIYNHSDITIVTPSKWLYKLAAQSPVFEGKKIHQIYHGIDLRKFKRLPKDKVRNELGIPLKAKVLMFGADKLEKNYWKGGKELFDILGFINSRANEKLFLLALGRGHPKELEQFNNFTTIFPGFIESEELLIKYYSAADLFLYPTRADNLPFGLIEPIACGLPCITFKIGGCPEIIKNNKNGFIIPPFNCEIFARKVLQTLNDKPGLRELSRNARKYAEEIFSHSAFGKNYCDFFTKILKKIY
ncbi:MAG: hypothetical protein A2V66_06140 [Ignavibacteria bacterium RBG_13_36_8]|nr:MAG: hypothetical protein A2V66_06140 [Ignavibacteria bacterium RBG_13_36_8]